MLTRTIAAARETMGDAHHDGKPAALLAFSKLSSQPVAHTPVSIVNLPFAATGHALSQAQLRMAELGLHEQAGASMQISRAQLPQQPLRAMRSSARFFQQNPCASEQHKLFSPYEIKPMVVHIEGRGADALVQPARCGCSHEDVCMCLPSFRAVVCDHCVCRFRVCVPFVCSFPSWLVRVCPVLG